MDISFKNKKTQKVFNSSTELTKKYGVRNARIIQRRMAVLQAAPTLADVPHRRPERRHQLEGKRQGEYAVDVEHPFRIVFKPGHNPIPKTRDGGVDLTRVTAIEILGIEDYH
ncbi:MAG TPA: killer suppression protein [Acidiferrobacteraceae bacterium]|nr:killer suppression protein [Acidiferrobacteraceae bacterium]